MASVPSRPTIDDVHHVLWGKPSRPSVDQFGWSELQSSDLSTYHLIHLSLSSPLPPILLFTTDQPTSCGPFYVHIQPSRRESAGGQVESPAAKPRFVAMPRSPCHPTAVLSNNKVWGVPYFARHDIYLLLNQCFIPASLLPTWHPSKPGSAT